MTDVEEEPEWATAAQSGALHYSNLNLDGVGGQDDEIYVSIYRWENADLVNRSSAAVLRAHLGTGETLSAVIPTSGHISICFGQLFSSEKDAIVIEIDVPYSNYGAANVFIYDIYSAEKSGDGFPVIIKRLDTYTDPAIFEKQDIRALTTGTKIVDLDDSEVQGLRIYYVNPNGNFQEESATLFWNSSDYTWLYAEG